jgi:hypothetical protein
MTYARDVNNFFLSRLAVLISKKHETALQQPRDET